MKHIISFEEFLNENVYNIEQIDEGKLNDWWRGVDGYTKKWKILFGYYNLLNKNKSAEDVVKRGIEMGALENNNDKKWRWPNESDTSRKARLLLAFKHKLDNVKAEIDGRFIATPGGAVENTANSEKMKEAAVLFKKDPHRWDEEIEKIAKTLEIAKS